MSGLEIAGAWRPLTADEAGTAPAQLGVFEIGDGDDTILLGYAGGREPFGLRSALASHVDEDRALRFRFELTHAYLTRWEELLMLYRARHGRLLEGNADHLHRVGRLHVDG